MDGYLELASIDKILGYLDGIEGGSFTNLITYSPQGEAILYSKILTDSTYKHLIFSCDIKRHRILAFQRFINHYYSFCLF